MFLIQADLPGVRLTGSKDKSAGFVEVNLGGECGTVCSSRVTWGSKEAQTVCKSLGYNGTSVAYIGKNHHEARTGRIWLHDLTCKEEHQHIAECESFLWDPACKHEEDQAVACYEGGCCL